MSKNRSSFTGKLGFVLAAAGSAVGLGNIWRFPYLAAKYGGGIFLLTYIILAVTFGFTLMVAEIAIGRKTGLSAIGAYKALDKRFSFVGYIASVVPIIILPYYCVIGGWVMKYFTVFITGAGHSAALDNYFDSFIADPVEPIGWFLLYLAFTAVVVFLGVEKGIEKVSKIMMPVLVVLTIIIAIYTVTLDGAWQGVIYYIKPDFSNFSATTVLAAMGQLFYSMSLSMGIMITYGSYMKKDVCLESSVRQIEVFDTGIAFLAGLMVIPAVFAFSAGDPEALGKGPGLMFVTLPKVFDTITGGTFVGILFFLLVLFAALTSSISLMETIVSIFTDKFKIKRRTACLAVIAICLLLGIPSSLGNGLWNGIRILNMDFLTFFDFASNSVLMPIAALITCIFIGYFIKPKTIIEEAEIGGKFKNKALFTVVIKFIAPVCIVLILISSVLVAFGIMKI
ncbi:MAG: sodium-dependent transporter [Clostridia bacterium]|nr:sodium-dependent transporter [Clostridia bacterium]